MAASPARGGRSRPAPRTCAAERPPLADAARSRPHHVKLPAPRKSTTSVTPNVTARVTTMAKPSSGSVVTQAPPQACAETMQAQPPESMLNMYCQAASGVGRVSRDRQRGPAPRSAAATSWHTRNPARSRASCARSSARSGPKADVRPPTLSAAPGDGCLAMVAFAFTRLGGWPLGHVT